MRNCLFLALPLLLQSASISAFLVLRSSCGKRVDYYATKGTSPLRTRRKKALAASRQREIAEENGVDVAYPWRFDGRLFFRPSIVYTPPRAKQLSQTSEAAFIRQLPGNVVPLSLLGWTLGGTACLEYDESPVGPYFEFVTMGSLVTTRDGPPLSTVGQWGSRLFVSTEEAEEVCTRVWGVPATLSDMLFSEQREGNRAYPNVEKAPSQSLSVAGTRETIRVSGWNQTRHGDFGDLGSDTVTIDRRQLGVPIFWTPTIKALWVSLVKAKKNDETEDVEGDVRLPVHRLRLSGSSIRFHWCGFRLPRGEEDEGVNGFPLPFALSVDGLRIEISRVEGYF